MIIFTSPTKPFEYTPKRSPRRHVSVALYQEEIDACYEAVEKSALGGVVALPQAGGGSWNLEGSMRFVRGVVGCVLTRGEGGLVWEGGRMNDGTAAIGDEVDLFEAGCDSLQATWIRNAILHAFRETGLPTEKVDATLVYRYPTISAMALFIAGVGGK